MLGQLSMKSDGQLRDKVQAAIDRLRCFEPQEGYWVAFSGGKDSQCVYHLCKMAGVKFEAHYAVTSVDPPELVQFIKDHYPDAWAGRVHQYNSDGKAITMWNLIPQKKRPPTRIVRYCCEVLKESSGDGRVTVTGVRWAESSKRNANHGIVTFQNAGKKQTNKVLDLAPSSAHTTSSGRLILNDDNAESRRAVEFCYRTHKTLVNPIVDWDDDDVWEFLNTNNIPHCCLYDEGFKRLGCIGCPLGGKQKQELQRWPKYREMYIRSFEKMLKARREAGVETTKWKNAEDVMKYWLQEEDTEG